MLYKALIIVGFLFTGLAGCFRSVGAPIVSPSDNPKLTTEFVLVKATEFRSIEDGFIFSHPEDWIVQKHTVVWVTPSEIDFPQDTSAIPTEATFTLFTKSPYTGRISRKWRIPQSASSVAQDIANVTQEWQIIKPVEAVDINGWDGAVYLQAPDDTTHLYSIILRIADDKVVVLGALGPASRSEEMQNILNAIALNIRPLNE